MPDVFSVGDRVEVRRGGSINTKYRQKRGAVMRLTNGMVRVKFANTIHDAWGDAITSALFYPNQLINLERGEVPQVFEVGARVHIADPASTQSPDGPGVVTVERDFWGKEGVIVRQHSNHEMFGVRWYVRLDGTGRENYIHQDYLTVIAAATAPSKGIRQGGTVVISSPAYYSSKPSTYDSVHPRYHGQVGQVIYGGFDGRWDLDVQGRSVTVHQNWLTPYADDAEPKFNVGDVAETAIESFAYSERRTPVPVSYAGKKVLLTAAKGPRFRVRLFEPVGAAETWIHQDSLTKVECRHPQPGQHVQINPGAVFRRGGESDFSGTIPNEYWSRVGTVVRVTETGNVKITHDGRFTYLHPAYCRILTKKEARTMVYVGARARVALDAHCYEDGSGNVPADLLGRVVQVRSANHGGGWRVQHETLATQGIVGEKWLKRIHPVTTVVSGQVVCGGCGEGVKQSQALSHSGYFYCKKCLVKCAECHSMGVVNNSFERRVLYLDGDWLCRNCFGQCGACGHQDRRTELQQDPGTMHLYCDECAHECDECSNFAFGESDLCSDCSGDRGSSALGGWRRTAATMWLGGPVRRKGGYYIGWENEISAYGNFTLKPLRQWAAKHLGSSGALDPKPDSTVTGFEIASQPMTPQFFEDVDWDSFFEMLNKTYPTNMEPDGHGLHVHIGRQAFRRPRIIKADGRGRLLKKPREVMVTDGGMIAAFTYLLSTNHDQLERIGRRSGTTWAVKVNNPVKAALTHPSSEVRGKQYDKYIGSIPIPRGAVNLTNNKTIEIRTAKSARSAQELKDAVRVVYLAAEYVRHLRNEGSISPKKLTWPLFAEWVGEVMPVAYASIAGDKADPKIVVTGSSPDLFAAFSTDSSKEAAEKKRTNIVMEEQERIEVDELLQTEEDAIVDNVVSDPF